MTPAQAHRASILCDALADLAEVERAATKREPSGGYDRRALIISIEDACDAGSTADATIELDLETADKVFPMLRGLIRGEIAALGVTLPREGFMADA